MSEIQMIRNNNNNYSMSNISKENNNDQFQMKKNIIEEKMNRFWKYYSNILIRFSWLILILSFCITLGLTICFLYFMKIRQFDQTDFLLKNSPSLKNAKTLQTVFGNDKDYRVHQQIELYPALDIIIKRKVPVGNEDINQTNMLNQQVIDEIQLLDAQIQSIAINNSNNSIQYNFASLCARINHNCVIDGNYLLSKSFRDTALRLKYVKSGIYLDTDTAANGIGSFIFSKNYQISNVSSVDEDYDVKDEEEEGEAEIVEETTTESSSFETIVSYVPIFRIRYSLNVSNNEMHDLSKKWERELYRYLSEKYHSALIELSISTSEAVSDTVSKQAHDDGPYMAIMMLIFFIFVCFFTSIQGNFHTSVGYLSLCGIIGLALSTGATFGFLSIIKIQIIEPMALLVFVVAIIECMRISILCGEYHRIIKGHIPINSTNISTKIDLQKVLPSILKSTYPYLIYSTVIIIIVYLISFFLTPMSCTHYLSLTLVIYVIMNSLTHSTFFMSCLIITLKRIQSRRHCLLCYHLPNDYSIRDRRKSMKKILSQKKQKLLAKIDATYKKLFAGFICLLSLVFIIISIWSVLSIDTRLFVDKFLPKNASLLRSYMKSQLEDYDIGPVIMFTIPKPINYTKNHTRLLMRRVLEQCLNEKTTNSFKLFWPDEDDVHHLLTSNESLATRISPYSQNDLVIKKRKNKSFIKASRFYCQYRSIIGDHEDIQAMNNMYKYAKESSIRSIFPYSVVFPHYESLERIRIEIYLVVTFMVGVTFLIILLFSFSFAKALLVFSHFLVLTSGFLACLYLFHNLTFNFANALWLYLVPVIYLDAIIHACFNNTKSKWKYNRVILSLIISLIIHSFFPVESYVFLIIRYALFYQSIICFILINLILPSWRFIIKTFLRKNKKEKIIKPPSIITTAVDTEMQNLVHEPNGNTHTSG